MTRLRDTRPRADDMSQRRGRVIERVCIIGGGVIGSLFAGHLAQVADVSVLTRRRDHAEALNREGLRISGRSELHVTVHASHDPAELEPFDLGIVATKVDGTGTGRCNARGAFPRGDDDDDAQRPRGRGRCARTR